MSNMPANPALMKAVPFTEEELAANRSGAISQAQLDRLHKLAGGSQVATLVMFVITILVIAGILAYLFVFSSIGAGMLKGFAKDPTMLAVIGGVLGIVVLIILSSFLRSFLRTADMRRGKISVAEGKTSLKTTRLTVGYAVTVAQGYELNIGRVKFYVTEDVAANVMQGVKYRAYYVKNYPMHVILSLEPLPA